MSKIRQFAWRHPEWWTLAISLVAWIVHLAAGDSGPSASHAGHHEVIAAEGIGSLTTNAPSAAHAMTMVLAMMVPLVIGSVRAVAFRSLWHRRHVAVAEFLTAYVGLWTAVCIAIAGLVAAAAPVFRVRPSFAAGVGFIIAAMWQMTSRKQRALRRCHVVLPLAPHGWRAHRDCIGYGLSTAVACMCSCWSMMLIPMLVPSSAAVMAAVSVMCGVERYVRRPALQPATLAMPLGALAIGCVMAALVQAFH